MTQAEEAIDFIEVDPNGSPYFCDWYSCLIDEPPAPLEQGLQRPRVEFTNTIIETLSGPMRLRDIKPCSGVPQYERSVALWSHLFADRAMFELSFGGNQGASPHLLSQGFVAHEGMKALRRAFPCHRVGRFDIAVDMVGEGLYEQISGMLHELHRSRGLKTKTVNHDVPEMGRTHYLGSRKSVAMVRLYEKWRKEQSEGKSFIRHHIRLELEIKPQKQADRARWASVSLEEAWGVTRWTRTLAERVLRLDAQRIRRAPPMKRTDLEAFQGLLDQHVKLIHRLDEEEAVAMLRAMYSHGKSGRHKIEQEKADAAHRIQ